MEPSDSVGADADSTIGSPHDYSGDLYRFYFELSDHGGVARTIISNFLREQHFENLSTVSFGYQFYMPIQCAPDLIRLLAKENIGIYQVVRLSKTTGVRQSSPTTSKQADD